jgi:hypothetical protein
MESFQVSTGSFSTVQKAKAEMSLEQGRLLREKLFRQHAAATTKQSGKRRSLSSAKRSGRKADDNNKSGRKAGGRNGNGDNNNGYNNNVNSGNNINNDDSDSIVANNKCANVLSDRKAIEVDPVSGRIRVSDVLADGGASNQLPL